jgi:hypothetical protein
MKGTDTAYDNEYPWFERVLILVPIFVALLILLPSFCSSVRKPKGD